jgi:hypothetical protein
MGRFSFVPGATRANYRLQCGSVAALNMKVVDLAFTIRSVPHHSKYPRLIDDITVALAGIGAITSEKVALLEIAGQTSLTFTANVRFVDLNSFKWTAHQLLIRTRLSSQIELSHMHCSRQ